MAEIKAFALTIQDVSAGPRFASVKIDGANLKQMLANRDGTFIANRINAALGFGDLALDRFGRIAVSGSILDANKAY